MKRKIKARVYRQIILPYGMSKKVAATAHCSLVTVCQACKGNVRGAVAERAYRMAAAMLRELNSVKPLKNS